MEVRNYKIIDKGVLHARFDLYLPKWGGFLIHGMTWCVKSENQQWISFPSYSLETPEGKKYLQHCRFEDREVQKDFERQVMPLLKNLQSAMSSSTTEDPEGEDGDLPF